MIKKVKCIVFVGLLSCFAADGMHRSVRGPFVGSSLRRTKGVQLFPGDTMGLRPVDTSGLASRRRGRFTITPSVPVSAAFGPASVGACSEDDDFAYDDQHDLICTAKKTQPQPMYAEHARNTNGVLQMLIVFCSRVESQRSTAAEIISEFNKQIRIPNALLSKIRVAAIRMKQQQS